MSAPTDNRALLAAESGAGKKPFVVLAHRTPPGAKESLGELSCASFAGGSLAVTWLERQDPASNHGGTEAGNVLFDERGNVGVERQSDLPCALGGAASLVPTRDRAICKTFATTGRRPLRQTAAGAASRHNYKRLLHELEHIGFNNSKRIEQGL